MTVPPDPPENPATGEWRALCEATLGAARTAVELLERSDVSTRWDEPSELPEMTIGALATHLAQMLAAGAGWLGEDPAEAAELVPASLTRIYGLARVDAETGLSGQVARRIRSWANGGSSAGPVATAVAARRDLAMFTDRLRAASPDRLIPSINAPGMGLRLDDYLRSRCVEFVVHVDDLARSVDIATPRPDPAAAAAAISCLIELCRDRVGDLAVLRALTRPERADPDSLRAL